MNNSNIKKDFHFKCDQLKAWKLAQGCTDKTYPAGLETWNRLDKLISDREQELNKIRLQIED